MTLAIFILALAALIGYGADPLAKWWARNEANTDRLIAEALDEGADQ